MLDLGRIHQIVLSEKRKTKPKAEIAKAYFFLFGIPFEWNEKNKYRSIKKYLPDLGFDMVLAEDNVLRINAVPEDLKRISVIKFFKKTFLKF